MYIFFFDKTFFSFIIMQIIPVDLFIYFPIQSAFYWAVGVSVASGNKILLTSGRESWKAKSSLASIVLWHKIVLCWADKMTPPNLLKSRQHYTFLFVNFLLRLAFLKLMIGINFDLAGEIKVSFLLKELRKFSGGIFHNGFDQLGILGSASDRDFLFHQSDQTLNKYIFSLPLENLFVT